MLSKVSLDLVLCITIHGVHNILFEDRMVKHFDLGLPDVVQPSCPSALEDISKPTDALIYNILYPSGDKFLLSTGEVVDDGPSDWI